MASSKSPFAIVVLTFFFFTFYPVLAINDEFEINTSSDNEDDLPPPYSTIDLYPANLEHDNYGHQLPAEFPAPNLTQLESLGEMEIDELETLFISVPWRTLASNIRNKESQERILFTFANFSRASNDFKFNNHIQKMMQAHWPFDGAIHVFKRNINYEMLWWCIHLGWRFDDSDSEFVNDLFQGANGFQFQNQAMSLCRKMLQVQNIINGTRDAVIDFILNVHNPEFFQNRTFSEFMMSQFSPGQKHLFFDRYLRTKGYEGAVVYMMDQLSPEQKTLDIVPILIRNQSFDLAAKLIERGWPIDKLNKGDLKIIRGSGHSGIRKAFPGIGSLFQKYS